MFTVTLQCYGIRFPFLSHHFQDKYNYPCFIILCSDTLSQLPTHYYYYTRPTMYYYTQDDSVIVFYLL